MHCPKCDGEMIITHYEETDKGHVWEAECEDCGYWTTRYDF